MLMAEKKILSSNKGLLNLTLIYYVILEGYTLK
jgi:hypothetical protein